MLISLKTFYLLLQNYSYNIIFIFLSTLRRACGHVDEGTCPHQVLAATLTLSQPGEQIMPTQYCSILVSTPSFEIHRHACGFQNLVWTPV